MGREIKFRGWSEFHSKWVYGWLVYNKSGEPSIRSCDDFLTYMAVPESVGQCIGFNDSVGIMIYEGDIVVSNGGVSGRIAYSEHAAMFGLVDAIYVSDNSPVETRKGETVVIPHGLLTVIGNKFEDIQKQQQA